MKRFLFGLTGSAAAAALLGAIAFAQASAPNVAGTWVVQQSGANGTSTSQVTLTQSGATIVGQNAKNGNGLTGTFVTDSKINGKWHGPGGAGWLTVYVTPNGHSLNGEWGYNGRAPNGTFVGNKVLPPSPITAKGNWNVALAGGPALIVGPMSCTESGRAAICKAGSVVINGAFKAKDKIRARWSRGGRNGWFSFWFNGDNNSFNGVWGYGPDTSPPVGRVVGQRSLG